MDKKLNEHDFHWKIETSKGTINVRADVIIRGNDLTMKDISIRPDRENKTGLKDEMQSAKSELFNRAKEQGFTRIDGSGVRVPGSTSAKPNKVVNFSEDLTKDTMNPVKEFQAHPDPMVKYGQDVNRLQALQKPYQTKQTSDLTNSKLPDNSLASRDIEKPKPEISKQPDVKSCSVENVGKQKAQQESYKEAKEHSREISKPKERDIEK